MEIIYTWNFKAYDRELTNNTIKNVHWELIAEINGKTEKVYGCLNLPKPNMNNFIEFEEITKEQITSWVENSMSKLSDNKLSENNETELEKIKHTLKSRLEKLPETNIFIPIN